MIYRSEESRDRIRYGSTNLEYYIKRSKRIKVDDDDLSLLLILTE
jgi:hypothetical protein